MILTNVFMVSGSVKKGSSPDNPEKIYVGANTIEEAFVIAKAYFDSVGGIIFDIERKVPPLVSWERGSGE